ncbi:MAG: DAK2 domain-containing protein [Actinobacteria bacterium]|nr:DAK2 domain-containing protein [Actinomycetota bacterium]
MAKVLDQLAATDFRGIVVAYRDALRSHQDELNRLNVYPVPDGDTGTNMALTLESVVGELDGAEGMNEVCRAISHGSLMGARGNSGVILSQILRGLSDTFSDLDAASAHDVVAGLRRAADAAYQAVLRPVEGTILTVVRASAEAAEAAQGDGAELTGILERVEVAAHDAVLQTPELLPVLKEAGVVDAGGRGFELLIDAFLHIIDGRPVPEPEVVATPPAVEAHLHGEEASSLRYEVMYLLEADDSTIPAFKDTWGALGDSIVVVGGDGLWNCHVHTNEIGAAIEAGIEAGRPAKIRVTDLVEQVEEEEWVRDQTDVGGGDEEAADLPVPTEPVATAVVAVGVGSGVQRLLTSLGVHAIVAGGQSMNPSTAQILEAVQQCPSDSVIVLPNNKNIVPVARQVDGLCDRRVEVVPTNAVVEALGALVAYDPHAPLEANVASMHEAVDRVRTGEVTQAVRDSVADCGPIAAGDWIAVTRSGIRAIAPSAAEAAIKLVEELLDVDSELVTVLVGAEARPADRVRLEEHLANAHPKVEIEVHEGNQPLYPFLVGVE